MSKRECVTDIILNMWKNKINIDLGIIKKTNFQKNRTQS